MKKCLFLFLFFLAIPGFTGLRASPADTRPISLHLRQVTLGAALAELAEQSEANLVYSDAVVDSLVISCDFSVPSVERALQRLLRNTSIAYKRQAANEFVLFLKKPLLTIDLTGIVFDAETGERLPYANILLAGTGRGTASNLEGHFVLPSAPWPPRSLRVKYIGYAAREIDLRAVALTTPLKIGLQPNTILTDPVTVRPDDWELIEVGKASGRFSIAPENFSLLPIVGDKDIFRSLQLLPGVSSSNQGSPDLYVRGGTPSENLILFDGMTLYHVDHSFGYFSAFNADAIKDVRVYKSAFPAKYGGRLSSVMEVTAKSGGDGQTRMQVGANLLDARAVVQAPLAGSGAILLSVRRSYSNYILDDLYNRNFSAFTNSIPRRQPMNFNPGRLPGAPPAADPDIRFYDIIAKANLAAGSRDKFTASFYAGQDDLERLDTMDVAGMRGGGPHGRRGTQQSGAFLRQEKADWGNRGVSFNWFRQWRETFQSTLMTAYSKFTSDQSYVENAPAFAMDPHFSGRRTPPGATLGDSLLFEISSNNDIRDFSLRFDNAWQANATHKLEFGVAVARSNLDYSNSGFLIVNNLQDRAQATQSAAYLEDSWQGGRRLTLTGGLRATYDDLTDSLYFEPRFSGNMQLLPGLSVKGSWGRNHQFIRRLPGFLQYTEGRDFWVLADGDAIRPGFAEHATGGAVFEKGGWLLDLEFYRSRQRDVTEGIPAVQYLTPQARTDIYDGNCSLARGLDALLQKKSGRFTGWIAYSYNRNRIAASVDGQRREFPANHDIPHTLNLVGSYTRNGWNLSATWTYATGAPYTRPRTETLFSNEFGTILRLTAPAQLNAARLPATHRLDLSLSRAFVTRHIFGTIGFSLYNVYDRENIWYRNFVLRAGNLEQEDVATLGLTPTLSVDLRFR